MHTYPSLREIRGLAGGSHTLLPVSIELPADTLTPVNAFLRLRASGSSQTFLLESADGGETVGRYSYLGIDPFASLISTAGQLTFQHFEDQTRETLPTSFAAIGQYLDRYSCPKLADLPPFVGGAIGYFSYDCVAYLENIPRAGAAYAPHEINFMFFKTILAFDRLRHRLSIVQLIPSDPAGLETAYAAACSRLGQIKERLTRSVPGEEIIELSFDQIKSIEPIAAEAMLGETAYCAAVKKIKDHIRRGDIFQCVLSDRFRFPVAADSFLIYRILRMINPSPYLYHLGFGSEYLLGASPEMLVRSQGRKVETCPIAGTRPRGRTPQEDKKLERDLMASVKEKAEHLMLVDLGRNDIGRVSRPGSVEVSSFMDVERYSHVMHIVSRVSGQLRPELSPWDAFGACFPAGTLSGAPKIKAMEIISRLEGQQRGPYGGAIVCKDFAGDLNTCITIRSLFLRDGIGYGQAGAGIVADSKPEKEYEEVLNKAKVVRTAVAAAQLVSRGLS